MFSNIKAEFTKVTSDAEWIDESTRERLLNRLKSLVPLIAYPDGGFDESAINEFYDGIKIDKNRYFRTLFQLRVIDADNKFRQTYTSTSLESLNNWSKYLPPTTVSASYLESDNTIRKIESMVLHRREVQKAVINFDLFPHRTLGWHSSKCCAWRTKNKLSRIRVDWIYHST